jgi:NTP pyrophosphatase (non-canonical NTP hydrolase)
MTELQALVNMCGEDSINWFPRAYEDPVHLVLGLCGEAGELANVVKKVHRGDATWDEQWDKFESEMADVLTYLLSIAASTGMDLEKVFNDKRLVNLERFASRPDVRRFGQRPTAYRPVGRGELPDTADGGSESGIRGALSE